MFEIFEGENGQFWWRLLDGNNEKVAGSLEGYTRERDAERAIENVKALAPTARIVKA